MQKYIMIWSWLILTGLQRENVSKNKLKFRDTDKVQSKLARKENEKTRQQYRAEQRQAKRNFEE